MAIATHALDWHICPDGQSAFVTQSTQYPSVVSQTCPGHMREVVHGVVVRHAF